MVTEINVDGIPMEEYKKMSIINNMVKGVKFDAYQTQADIKRSTRKGIKEPWKPRKITRGKVRSLSALEIIQQYGKERVLNMANNNAAAIFELIGKTGRLTTNEIAEVMGVRPIHITQQMYWIVKKIGDKFNIDSNKKYGFTVPGTDWRVILEEYKKLLGIKPNPDMIKQKRKYTRRAVDVVVNEILQTTPVSPNDQVPGTISLLDLQTDAKLLMTQLSSLLEMGKMAIENFNRKYS